MQHGERQVLELELDRLDAEPVGQRRVDLERLLGLAGRRRLVDESPGAGVVEPVGELDDQHPDVLRHRDDHLAHGLGLRAVAVLQLVELGDPVDQHRDLVAEVLAHHVERVLGVLDGVVQQRRRDRPGPDAEVGQDLRDRDRVADVRLTALAELPGVRLLRGGVRALDEGDVALRMVGAHGLDEAIDRPGRLRPREDARQERAQGSGVGRRSRSRSHLPDTKCRLPGRQPRLAGATALSEPRSDRLRRRC